jgi:hypothetical protein
MDTLPRAFSGPGFLPQRGKKCAQISEVKRNCKDVRKALKNTLKFLIFQGKAPNT